MRTVTVRHLARPLCGMLALFLALLVAAPAIAAGYPRRIAVAPFESLTREDIGSTVSVLPRLVSSRLMALAGADVLLLPAGGKSPADAAKEAKYPLLLQGTVSKLGKGYSIDVVVTDLAEGKSAGAFFAAAATEDDIIAQLGILSGEISEKVFGVQGAVRAVAPVVAAPVVAAPVVAAPGAGSAGTAVVTSAAGAGAAGTAGSAGIAAVAGAGGVAGATTLAGGWAPSSLKKISQSDKIVDEVQGVVTLEADADGNGMVVAYGKNAIYLYKVKGTEFLPYTRYSRPISHHILHVDAIDIDGDGEKEILVTDLIEESVQSFILKKNKTGGYEETGEKIRYYMVVLPDWQGKPALVGQYQGVTTPFQGKIVALRWDGKQLVPGEALPHDTNISPLSSGILGLSSARFGKEWRLIYTDPDLYLRVLDGKGKSMYKSRTRLGMSLDLFEWGPVIPIEGRRAQFPLRVPARVASEGGEDPLVLITEVKRGLLDLVGGSYDSTRLVLLQWEAGEFAEKAGSKESSHFLSGADFLSSPGFRKGGKVIASAIEQTGLIFKDKVSRLHMYQAD